MDGWFWMAVIMHLAAFTLIILAILGRRETGLVSYRTQEVLLVTYVFRYCDIFIAEYRM